MRMSDNDIPGTTLSYCLSHDFGNYTVKVFFTVDQRV